MVKQYDRMLFANDADWIGDARRKLRERRPAAVVGWAAYWLIWFAGFIGMWRLADVFIETGSRWYLVGAMGGSMLLGVALAAGLSRDRGV